MAKNVYMREFICPVCGIKMIFPKRRMTGKNHTKHAWCYKCKGLKGFKQLHLEIIKVRT